MKNTLFWALIIGMMISIVGCSKSNHLALSGTIEATEIDVNSEVNGKVVKVLKEEGSSINIGDVIAEIDPAAAELQVKNAEAALKAGEAKYDELKVGSRAESIVQAQAAVKQAKARLDEMKSGTRPEQLKQAKAAENQAKARLEELKKGNRSEQITQAEAQHEQAKRAVSKAQIDYDDKLSLLSKKKEMLSAGAVSQRDVDIAKAQSDTAYQELQRTKDEEKRALSYWELLKNGSTTEAIDAAQAAYNQAVAYRELLEKGNTSQSIEAAEGAYEQALAQWELVKNGSTAQTLLAAEANVEQLQAVLDSAKLQVSKHQIKAPIQGTLLYRSVEPGKVVSSGTNIATIQTTGDYWIKVYVPQKYNGSIVLNQKVKVKTSALPKETLEGTVIFKSPKAEFTPKNIETTESKEENTVIAIKVKINTHIDKLSAGMLASVYVE